jgi:hypothetical protein
MGVLVTGMSTVVTITVGVTMMDVTVVVTYTMTVVVVTVPMTVTSVVTVATKSRSWKSGAQTCVKFPPGGLRDPSPAPGVRYPAPHPPSGPEVPSTNRAILPRERSVRRTPT